jgi:hypothetical protein
MKWSNLKISRPKHSTLVAYLALFVALGGTSYALTVTSNDVPKNALTGADIKGLTAKGFKASSAAPIDSDVIEMGFTTDMSGSADAFVPCPPGKVITGGGYGNALRGFVDASLPAGDRGWVVAVDGAPPNYAFSVLAVCATGNSDKK